VYSLGDKSEDAGEVVGLVTTNSAWLLTEQGYYSLSRVTTH